MDHTFTLLLLFSGIMYCTVATLLYYNHMIVFSCTTGTITLISYLGFLDSMQYLNLEGLRACG